MDEVRRIKTSSAELIYRVQFPESDVHPPVIMLHGWTGDEGAMWVLTSALPGKGLIAAARGIESVPDGDGFGWTEPEAVGEERWGDFDASVIAITDLADHLSREFSFDRAGFVLVGFSQGAALAFAMARAGFRPAGAVALAAYIPEGDLDGLARLPVYWGHGTQDQKVRVERARADREALIQAGAEVTYCEADVGHKVGVECMRGIDRWFQEYILNTPAG